MTPKQEPYAPPADDNKETTTMNITDGDGIPVYPSGTIGAPGLEASLRSDNAVYEKALKGTGEASETGNWPFDYETEANNNINLAQDSTGEFPKRVPNYLAAAQVWATLHHAQQTRRLAEAQEATAEAIREQTAQQLMQWQAIGKPAEATYNTTTYQRQSDEPVKLSDPATITYSDMAERLQEVGYTVTPPDTHQASFATQREYEIDAAERAEKATKETTDNV